MSEERQSRLSESSQEDFEDALESLSTVTLSDDNLEQNTGQNESPEPAPRIPSVTSEQRANMESTNTDKAHKDHAEAEVNNLVDDVLGDTKSEQYFDSSDDDEGSSHEEEKKKDERAEDYIDEDKLKEEESIMTDDEKQEAYNKAQEMKAEGNVVFKDEKFSEAIKLYTAALRICPTYYVKERSIMYSNRGAAKMRQEKYPESIADCTKAVELNPNYLKALYRRAELYEKTDKLDEALSDFKQIVEMDPSQHAARAACMRLPEQINERNEKMKAEMMGKLKDLGNMVLRPFGLSTNNFQLNQDSNTGGYSVNFVQNQPK